MAKNEDPIFNLELVKKMDQDIDHKIKDLRRIPKPKKEEDKEEKAKVPEMPKMPENINLEDLKNFDYSKLNMTDEKL